MSHSPAKICVIVPVYNRALLVAATLDSIEKQTSRDFELVLVDNNSTDGTYAVLDQWRSRLQAGGIDTRLISCDTPGAAAARNAGLDICRCEWVMFFDSDDIMPPGHIASALTAIARHPEAELIGWDTVIVEQKGNRSVKTFARHGDQWHNLMHGGMATQRWCARTELIRRAGSWNPDIRFWDDIELGCRILDLKPKISYTGLSGVTVYANPDSITATYASDPARIEPALQSIERVTGRTLWTDLKRAVEYARTARADNSRGKKLMGRLMRRNKGMRKLILGIAYWQTRLGLPGAARLAKPLCTLLGKPKAK